MIEELVGRLGGPLVVVPLTLLVLYISWSKTTVQHALPNLPWVGKRLETFSETRATYRSFTNVRIWLEEGYAKVRNGEASTPEEKSTILYDGILTYLVFEAW